MKMTIFQRAGLCATFCLLATSLSAAAVDGVTDSEILVGQTAVFEGSAKALGIGMNAGLQAAFNDINAAGGINGRTVRIVTRDDGYEPDKSIVNTRALIEEDKALLLIGGVGTPTAKVIVPICEEEKVPFVGAFTGAGLLRDPFKRYVVNVRGSYNQEMERLAAYLVDEKGLKKVACFYQNDAYGQAGLSGIEKALASRGMELAATGHYERNTTAVKGGLVDIRKAKPEAVIMVGAYTACSEFIKLAKKLKMDDVVYCNISFVGTRALQAELGDAGEGSVISQVVPHPDGALPLLDDYRASLKRHYPDMLPDWVSLEGYLVGRFFADAAAKAGRDLTRETFIDTVDKTSTFKIGGLSLGFGPDDHQGLDQVFLTEIKGGEVISIDSAEVASN